MIQKIQAHLKTYDFDIRKSNDARFMDQKVTPDVLCIMADCVVNFTLEEEIEFTKDDIWNSQYFNSNVKGIFNKPDATKATTRQEYDKFTSQPLRTLAYAGILNLRRESGRNYYQVRNQELLEFIGMKERNAFIFLYFYLEKVLEDSNFLRYFENFEQDYHNGKLDSSKFLDLKSRFQRFIIGNTAVNGITEVNRIFPKVLNIFSCYRVLPGTILGRLSDREIYFSDLMYNRTNWRDLSKSKSLSRYEAYNEAENFVADDENIAYTDYQVQKAIKTINKLYRESEIKDQWAIGEATQVHHIFPRSSFPELAPYLENLIKLTPTQHFTKAHPGNKTQEINKDYQVTCLLAKANNIEKSLSKGEMYYRKESFIHVINLGLNKNWESSLGFREIKGRLSRIFNN